jgi:inner membrane protein
MIFVLLMMLVIIAVTVWLVLWLIRYLRRPGMATTTDAHSSRLTTLTESLTVRSVIIAVLALVMLIPLGLVGNVVNERDYRYRSVLSDIASTWGEAQTLLAPVVAVPFTETIVREEKVTDEDGKSRLVKREAHYQKTAHFLPEHLDIDIRLTDEIRRRGIFESLVYRATIEIDASFDGFDVKSLSNNTSEVHWDQAWLAVGLSDTRAINSVDDFQWNNSPRELAPGTRLQYLSSGFHATLGSALQATRRESHTLRIAMNVNGSDAFRFAPLGETTRVELSSVWPHPSFQGDALPDQHNISADGFNARWTIPHLARNYPQRWMSGRNEIDLREFTAGVSMFEPVSLYSRVTRAVKYGILFIGLTFLTLLIFEMSIDRKLHVIQYVLIGSALCLFFLVLLSLSEHMRFHQAYASAAILVIAMIGSYTWLVLRSMVRAAGVMAMLIALYAVLYSLLQLEDYALLMGTALLVFVLMVLMFVTRSIQPDPRLPS